MTTHRTHVKLARRHLIALLRTGALNLPNQSTAAHSVRVDVRLVLDADVLDHATQRACVDALTEELAERYERGWNVEAHAYEPGTSEWLGMIVSNADRILVRDGSTLAQCSPEQARAYVERLLRGEEQVRFRRDSIPAGGPAGFGGALGAHEWSKEMKGPLAWDPYAVAASPEPPLKPFPPPLPLGAVGRGGGEPLTPVEEERMRKAGLDGSLPKPVPTSRATGAPAEIPVGDATILVTPEASTALHVNGVLSGRYEPRSQANCTTVMLAAEALFIHEAMRIARRSDVFEGREVSFIGGMLALALTKGTHLTAKQSGWLEQLYTKAARVEASEGRLIRHAAPDVIKCERFTGLAER